MAFVSLTSHVKYYFVYTDIYDIISSDPKARLLNL